MTQEPNPPNHRDPAVVEAAHAWLKRQQPTVRLVFDSLAPYDDFFHPFATFEASTGLTRAHVRRACRHLTRGGLFAYQRGLFSESTGEPAGAGYGLTPLGVEIAQVRSDLPYVPSPDTVLTVQNGDRFRITLPEVHRADG